MNNSWGHGTVARSKNTTLSLSPSPHPLTWQERGGEPEKGENMAHFKPRKPSATAKRESLHHDFSGRSLIGKTAKRLLLVGGLYWKMFAKRIKGWKLSAKLCV